MDTSDDFTNATVRLDVTDRPDREGDRAESDGLRHVRIARTGPEVEAGVETGTGTAIRPHRRRRILSIDGGGVRCVIAMEYLCALERELRAASGDPERRLRDHFDLVAGTSAGGLLASGIALGIPMTEVREYVMANVADMFARSPWRARFRSLYDKTRLARSLKARLGEDTTLGSERLRTGLMLMVRNWSSDSEWLLTNREGAAPDGDPDDSHLDLPLWQIALASASAPAYFRPETVRYGRREPRDQVLDDGGMTGYLNPAFRAFRYATGFETGPRWRTGEDALSVVSIGSGDAPHRRTMPARGVGVPSAVLGMPNAMLQASVREQDALCRTFGRRPDEPATGSGRLFRYHRVNPSLATAELASLGFPHVSAGEIMPMDRHANLAVLSEIGQAFAVGATSVVLADCLEAGPVS